MKVMLVILSLDMLAKCMVLEEDTTIFGHVGRNLTVYSSRDIGRTRQGLILWYHETHGGRILLKDVSFSLFSTNISFTIEKLTFMDSGRYFPVFQYQYFSRPIIISNQVLVVTDPLRSPVMRMFDNLDGILGTRELLCEVEGAGAGWSDPFWVIEHEGEKTDARQQTETRLNQDGKFLRWTRLSLPLLENSTRKVLCMCHHDTEGRIQISAMDGGVDRGSAVFCDLLFFFGPLCVLILLVTLVFMGRRLCSSRL